MSMVYMRLSVADFYDLKKGKVLGRNYRVLEYLGSGWEGEVYKVEERKTGIIRAAKLFYHRKANGENPHIHYAKKLYKLRKCPIVIQYHFHDIIYLKKKKIDFLVSDFVDGEVLSSYIARQKGKRLLPFEALHLLYALTQGVEQIHFQGEYHGDIHSENIMVKKKGLGFEVHLIDLLHLGSPTKDKIQQDVYDLINIFYEMIGGATGYRYCNPHIKQFVLGRKHNLIREQFNTAGHLRLHLENIEWD
ncbi:Dot/Icm T4SS effector protein kinase CoxK1 [Coxiella burnetii]|uniref:Dot/Icm T4SS effector protein kinase CoxK1 n=1 Tax=Coxiella burnetii TaxID=777 RepID=UPI000593E5F1|nr:Dot/Icm T4SS effector protein kinase CoxK1 [Coxiella burnetii]ATN73704.1 serine/threonine protein kinase [Coxiella burnetii]ATN75611.1 serine/threonine protein kinase [Coxiella burnetii]ATN77526.1 serine/threonine protein kinase [Coxiella burnetii]ATN79441.1 serine/threonine protein kinase [Coxiella burnetii]OYK92659.1 serine/threonine protein kinase [Coxiella burnetii]